MSKVIILGVNKNYCGVHKGRFGDRLCKQPASVKVEYSDISGEFFYMCLACYNRERRHNPEWPSVEEYRRAKAAKGVS